MAGWVSQAKATVAFLSVQFPFRFVARGQCRTYLSHNLSCHSHDRGASIAHSHSLSILILSSHVVWGENFLASNRGALLNGRLMAHLSQENNVYQCFCFYQITRMQIIWGLQMRPSQRKHVLSFFIRHLLARSTHLYFMTPFKHTLQGDTWSFFEHHMLRLHHGAALELRIVLALDFLIHLSKTR